MSSVNILPLDKWSWPEVRQDRGPTSFIQRSDIDARHVMLCLSYPQWCLVYLFTPLIWRLISKDWMLLYKFKTVFYFRGSSIRDDVWKRLLLRQKWGWTIIFLYFIFVNKVVKSYLVPDWFTIEVVKSYLVPDWFTILSY